MVVRDVALLEEFVEEETKVSYADTWVRFLTSELVSLATCYVFGLDLYSSIKVTRYIASAGSRRI